MCFITNVQKCVFLATKQLIFIFTIIPFYSVLVYIVLANSQGRLWQMLNII